MTDDPRRLLARIAVRSTGTLLRVFVFMIDFPVSNGT
jgi:hypothetical protein